MSDPNCGNRDLLFLPCEKSNEMVTLLKNTNSQTELKFISEEDIQKIDLLLPDEPFPEEIHFYNKVQKCAR